MQLIGALLKRKRVYSRLYEVELYISGPMQFCSHLIPFRPLLTRTSMRTKSVSLGNPQPSWMCLTTRIFSKSQLRQHGFTMPRAWTISADTGQLKEKKKLDFPIVAKPIRGRGSFGVKVCHTMTELEQYIEALSQVSPTMMLAEFLAGEEATIMVMPPACDKSQYWALPPVVRFNHEDNIAPYNGVVAVTADSRVLSTAEIERGSGYKEAVTECEEVARLLQVTAPIRVDLRRFATGRLSPFALFDVNMKPVSQPSSSCLLSDC